LDLKKYFFNVKQHANSALNLQLQAFMWINKEWGPASLILPFMITSAFLGNKDKPLQNIIQIQGHISLYSETFGKNNGFFSNKKQSL